MSESSDSERTVDASPTSASFTPSASVIEQGREAPGSVIGNYRLVERIGEGGFGSVFLAEQEKPVKRRVALKIIKLGMDTREVIARFEAERQALAMMDHPSIAKVYDAGATETGRPYFVMELVRGVPITEYCDTNRLTIPERLALFRSVCAAVQHAHQKGIIHRDIKPSNVLVSSHDGGPIPKVIDFGIAKATSSRLTERTIFTERRELIGTPEYMSPEQADPSIGDVDTRSDIYSLGVLLYELLTGATPFDGKRLRSAAFGEIQRIIREEEPIKPSTRLSSQLSGRRGGEGTARVTAAGRQPVAEASTAEKGTPGRRRVEVSQLAEFRRTDPASLVRTLKGELDWIVLRAMEKDRTRRYETANGLAADIERFLTGQPVSAVPPSTGYVLSKFIRRNRLVVGAGVAVFAAVTLGAGVATVGFISAVNSRDAETEAKRAAIAQAAIARSAEAEAERRRAEAENLRVAESQQRALAEESERKAAAVNKFLVDMLGSAKLRELGRAALVSQAVDRAAEKVGDSFKDQPKVEAAIRSIIGETYVSLGIPEKAEPHLEAAARLVGRTSGEDSLEFAEVMLHTGSMKQQRGDPVGSAEANRRGYEIVRRLLGPEHLTTLGYASDYANALARSGRREEAEKLFREVLEIRSRSSNSDSRDTQVLLNSLGVLMHELERLDEAEDLYRRAVEMGIRVMGTDDPDTIVSRFNFASLLRSRGKYDEAVVLMEEGLAAAKRVFGPSHPKTGSAARNLAQLYENMGRFKDCLAMYEEAVDTFRRAQGEKTEAVGDVKRGLAGALSRMGEFKKAIPVYKDAIDILTQTMGAEAGDVIDAKLGLANAYSSDLAYSDAEPLFREMMESAPRILGENSEQANIAFNSFSVMLMRQDRYAEAEPILRRALESGRAAQGADHRTTIITQYNLAVTLRETGRLEEAESVSLDAVERARRSFGPKHPTAATFLGGHAATLAKLGRVDDAKKEYLEAIGIVEEATGKNSPTVGSLLFGLGEVMNNAGRYSEAESVLTRLVEIRVTSRGPDDFRVAYAKGELGRCFRLAGKFEQAEQLLVDARRIFELTRPPGHADLLKNAGALADLYKAWNEKVPDEGRAAKAADWRSKSVAEPVKPGN